MTILITGVAGLIGSNFSRFLLKKGYKVIGIDNFYGGYEDFLPVDKNFFFYKRNLETDSIEDVFQKEKPKVVFHFAAYAAEGLSPFIRIFNYQNNVITSVRLVNECIKHDCKLVFTSSMAVYGRSLPPFTEDMPLTPIDPYGIAKMSVESDIKQAHDHFNLRYNIVRPHNVIGVYQNIWDRYRNVVGIFIRKSLNNQPILIYGDGNQTRAFSDIDYYMEPLEKLIHNFDNNTFNIGADKYFSINEVSKIVKEVGEKNNLKVNIEHREERNEVKHAYCNHEKAKTILDFNDKTNIEDLIAKMFDWAKAQPNRRVKDMRYEIEKGIYSYWK